MVEMNKRLPLFSAGLVYTLLLLYIVLPFSSFQSLA